MSGPATVITIVPPLAGVPPSALWGRVPLGSNGQRLMVACSVRLIAGGAQRCYEGLFRSTCDAVIDAMDRYPDARRISAQAREVNA